MSFSHKAMRQSKTASLTIERGRLSLPVALWVVALALQQSRDAPDRRIERAPPPELKRVSHVCFNLPGAVYHKSLPPVNPPPPTYFQRIKNQSVPVGAPESFFTNL